ncbi:CLUMA_CG006797, isoform A [Clunio marinus]|uniref:CLUMA_CG006797, isoform A n=1 Tax=Clunio marinus TaxID=568069 RepID=A0A1J1I322_9DIPT|nr:CLUMA_CG006797, isoform A [Clunio marinus]
MASAVKKMKPEEKSLADLIDKFELMIQHLSGTDLINLSETSKEWYKTIAYSPEAIQKIQLVIDEDWGHEFEFDDVKDSYRGYRSIKIKSLLRRRCQVLQTIIHFGDHLTHLSTSFDFHMEGYKLPMLKFLEFRLLNNSPMLEDGLLSSVTTLTKLEVSGSVILPQYVVACLHSNPDLETLIIEYCVEKVFSFMFTPINIKLKTLKVNKACFSFPNTNKFHDFVISQASTLEELKILNCEVTSLRLLLDSLNNLKCLTFSPCKGMVYDCLRFSTYSQLTDLNLIGVTAPVLDVLLLSFPNLYKLYIADPTIQMISSTFLLSEELREFNYAFVRGGDYTTADILELFFNEKERNHPKFSYKLQFIQQI